MSIAISQEEYEMGISLIHDKLRDAIDTYEEFLITFGTCPDMTLAQELKKIANKILSHDVEKPIKSFKWVIEDE